MEKNLCFTWWTKKGHKYISLFGLDEDISSIILLENLSPIVLSSPQASLLVLLVLFVIYESSCKKTKVNVIPRMYDFENGWSGPVHQKR